MFYGRCTITSVLREATRPNDATGIKFCKLTELGEGNFEVSTTPPHAGAGFRGLKFLVNYCVCSYV